MIVDATEVSGLIPTVNTFLPWTIDIDVYATAGANTNWDTLTVNTSAIHNGMKDSTGAQNAEISWDIVVPAGTWDFELMHAKSADRGIYTVSFTVGTETTWGTIDGFKSGIGTDFNQRSSLSGIAINTTSKGTLKLKMATKNASSSNYVGSIQGVRLQRTDTAGGAS